MAHGDRVIGAALRTGGTVLIVTLSALAWPVLAGDSTEPSDEPAVIEKPVAGKSEYARRISSRNSFGLVDPPKPVETPPPVPPPAPTPVSNVQLTGFSRWAGEIKVYLMVTKQGAKGPDYFDLREGDERADIKVLQIDDHNEIARISNAGVEQTLNFKDNGTKPNPTAVPGAPNPGAAGNPVPPPPVAAPNRFGGVGPTVVGRGGVVENMHPGQVPQIAPTAGIQQPQFNAPNTGASASVNVGAPDLPAGVGQNPSINRSRVFNIPPPPLPPGQ